MSTKGIAGSLYLNGYFGLAFVMGWTGGYCLVALLLAPYLRTIGQSTIPDFLGARYGGHIPRFVGALAVILCSFTYVVAQIYGAGLVTTHMLGVSFEAGIVLIVAYLIPVIWLSVKHTNFPIPHVVYGKVLEKVTAREAELIKDPKEIEVRKIFKERADAGSAKLKGLPNSYDDEKALVAKRLENLKAQNAPAAEVQIAQRDVENFPKSVDEARRAWTREAGLFGIPLGFAVIYIVSRLTPPPDRATQDMIDQARYPPLRGLNT